MVSSVERRRRAVQAAYIGGALLILTGSTGAVRAVTLGWRAMEAQAPQLGHLLWPVFVAAMILCSAGGFSVMLGGYLMSRDRRFVGRAIIALGAGVGLIPLALTFLFLLSRGANPFESLFSFTLSLQGVGLLFALYAQATG